MKKRNKRHVRGLQFERLEDRLALAGDVLLSEKISTVKGVQVKDVTLTGDAQANEISITRQENGNWLIEGQADTKIAVVVNKVKVTADSRVVELPAGGIRTLSIDMKTALPTKGDAVSLSGDVNGEPLVVGGDLKIVGKNGGVVDLDHVEARGKTTITFGNGLTSSPIGSVVNIADSSLGVNALTGKKGTTTITTGINDDRVLVTDTQFGGNVTISVKDGSNNVALLGTRSDDFNGFASSTTVNGNLSLTASSGLDRLGVLGLVVNGNLTLATGKGNDFSGAADMAVLGKTSVTSTDGNDVAAIGLRDANDNPLPENGFGNVMRGAVTVNLGNGNDVAAAHKTTFGGVVNGKLVPAKITVTMGSGDDRVAESENTFLGKSGDPDTDAFNAFKASKGGADNFKTTHVGDVILYHNGLFDFQMKFLQFESQDLSHLDGILEDIFKEVELGFHDILLDYGIDIGGGGGGSDDHGDVTSEATDLGVLPTSITGTIENGIDVDMFSFTVETGETVEFRLTPDGVFNPAVRIFGTAGAPIPPVHNLGLGGQVHFFVTFDQAGTYFAGVSGFQNTIYNPITGANTIIGETDASKGSYSLEVGSIPADDDDAIDELLPTLTVDGGAAFAEIDNVFDVDLYRLELSVGQVVNIQLAPDFSPDLQLVLRVFDDSGNVLHTIPALSGGFNAELLFDTDLEGFPAGGTFFIGVSSFGNDSYSAADGTGDIEGDFTGFYSLSATEVILDDHGSIISEATDLGGPATSTSGIIEIGTDVDLFSFTVEANQIIEFALTPSGIFNPALRLFDASGTPISGIFDQAVVGEVEQALFLFDVAGTYFVGVSGTGNDAYDAQTGANAVAGDAGSYDLFIDVSIDEDDQTSEAVDLGAASLFPSTFGAIESGFDVDMFSFTAEAGQLVTIQVTPNAQLEMAILLFGGSPLSLIDSATAGSLGDPVQLLFNVTETGTYFFGVSVFLNTGYDPETGNGDVNGGQAGPYFVALSI